MNERRGQNGRVRLVRPGLTAFGISLAFLAGYMVYWLEFGLVDFPFGVPGTFYLLGAVLAVQLVRGARMDDWIRRGVAAGTVVGAVAMVTGLNATGSCPMNSAIRCSTSLDPNVPLVAVGVLLTGASLTADIVRRRNVVVRA